MKQLMEMVPFLAFLLVSVAHAVPSIYNTPGRGYSQAERDRDRGTSRSGTDGNVIVDKNKKGYEIVIKMEDAFGEAANDMELIKEMAVDIKVMKVLLEEIAPDIKDLRTVLIPGARNLTDRSPELLALRQYSSRMLNNRNLTDNRLQDAFDSRTSKANCAEIRLRGEKKSGYFWIQPDKKRQPIQVYCDMENEDGGWTVIQRRGVLDIPKSIRENFYRSWADYENGFGNVQKDYWIGLENIHALTHDCNNELLINLTNWDGASTYAKYSKFNISGRSDFYRLSVSGYSGNAGDALINHNKMRFTTYDKQNDLNGAGDNCAVLYHGAWWYKDCFWSNLNGEYAENGSNGKMTTRQGIEWGSASHFYSFMKTEMKIRPKC